MVYQILKGYDILTGTFWHIVEGEIDASEWDVGKPNRNSNMGSWDDTQRLSVWWQAYPSKETKAVFNKTVTKAQWKILYNTWLVH